MLATSINHPVALLGRWRAEAARMREHAKAADSSVQDVFMARALTLEQCADELQNRLAWSRLADVEPVC